MLKSRGLFSESYNEHLKRVDNCRRYVIEAQQKLKDYTLFGKKININNPEEVIAALYLLYKDYEAYHE